MKGGQGARAAGFPWSHISETLSSVSYDEMSPSSPLRICLSALELWFQAGCMGTKAGPGIPRSLVCTTWQCLCQETLPVCLCLPVCVLSLCLSHTEVAVWPLGTLGRGSQGVGQEEVAG